MTAPNAAERPSFGLLMQAQEILGQARDAEQAAGHLGASMVINDLVLSMFQIAIMKDFDTLADRAYAARYPNDPEPAPILPPYGTAVPADWQRGGEGGSADSGPS